MKNIQIIDDAINCTYDIFSTTEEMFNQIFPDGTDIEFEEDFCKRVGHKKSRDIFSLLWSNRVDKKKVSGIHGTLFFGEHCEDKRPFYPTKKDSEMIANP